MTATTKVMALHTIERMKTPGTRATKDTLGVPPVTETIKPFTAFNATADEVKDYLAQGAITKDIDGRMLLDLTSTDEMSDKAQAEAQRVADETAKAEAARKAADAEEAAKAEAARKAADAKKTGNGKTDPLV
jgi:hypothetical protein